MTPAPATKSFEEECKALADQNRQLRADLHLLGVSDQNRALAFAAITGAFGLAIGYAVGRLRK